MEYKKTFLNKIKLLLPYFIEFSDDGFILLKVYSNDCIVGGLDWKHITMIIYDKSTFFANNGQWKI